MRPREFEVAAIPDDTTARAYVLKTHYLASYPAARERFGLYRRGRLAGVAVYSIPPNAAALTNAFRNVPAGDLLELGRFVLDDGCEFNSETWFQARCRELLKREGYAGIVAFSDDVARTDASNNKTFLGHIGTIYSAASATFLGRGTARTLRLLPDGRTFSDRAAQKIRKGEQGWRYASRQLEAHGATPAPEGEQERREWLRVWTRKLTRPLAHPGNLKFAFSLHRAAKLPPSLPYPKIKAADLQVTLF